MFLRMSVFSFIGKQHRESDNASRSPCSTIQRSQSIQHEKDKRMPHGSAHYVMRNVTGGGSPLFLVKDEFIWQLLPFAVCTRNGPSLMKNSSAVPDSPKRAENRKILPDGKKMTWFSLGWGGNPKGGGSASPSGSGRDTGIASPHGGE